MNPEVTIKIATSSEAITSGEAGAPPAPTELPDAGQVFGTEQQFPVPESIEQLGLAAAQPFVPGPAEEIGGAGFPQRPQPLAPEELEAQTAPGAAAAQRGPEPLTPEQLKAAGASGTQALTPEGEPEKEAGRRRSRSTRTKKE